MPFTHVRSAALTNYAEVARSLGLDPFAQLRAAGLDVACLNNPDLKIPVVRVHALLESSAHAAGVDDFGLRMAMSRRLSNLGLIALAAREEPTVRDALACLQRTMHLHNEALRLVIEEENDVVVLREQILARVQGSMRQGIELSIGVLYRIVKEFLGDNWAPMAVCFMHEAPRSVAPYRKAFGCSVQFNSVINGITCRRRDLDRAMPGADPQSLRTIQQYLDSAAQHQPTQADRTTHLILSLLPSGRCTAELVARYLGIDRRTLHRRLDGEETSFSALMDDVRKEAALRHLANPHQSIADLALMLGFSDGTAFSRGFSGKFGCPPRRWRIQALATGTSPAAAKASPTP
jgi:AraC-like DNA-binding protein